MPLIHLWQPKKIPGQSVQSQVWMCRELFCFAERDTNKWMSVPGPRSYGRTRGWLEELQGIVCSVFGFYTECVGPSIWSRTTWCVCCLLGCCQLCECLLDWQAHVLCFLWITSDLLLCFCMCEDLRQRQALACSQLEHNWLHILAFQWTKSSARNATSDGGE